MSSNVSVVARGIAAFQGDPAIKSCLQGLFNFEMQNHALKNSPYKAAYVRELDKHIEKWNVEGDDEQ